MRRILKWGAIAGSAISAAILLLFPDNMLFSIVNVALSMLLFVYPAAFIPLIMVSSISSSIAIIGGFSAVFYYMALFVVSQFLRSGIKLRLTLARSYLWLALFCAWAFLCGVKSVSGDVYNTIRLLVFIVALWLCAASGNMSYRKCLEALELVSPPLFFILLVKLIFAPEIYTIEGTYVSTYRLTIAEHINPNQFAAYLAVVCVIMFIRTLKRRRFMPAAAFVLGMLLLALIKSRTSFYGTLMVSGCYYLFSYRSPLRRKLVLSAVAGTLVLAQAFLTGDKGGSSKSPDDRQLNLTSIVDDSGSGRFLTWAEAFASIIPGHPVFGIGIGKENYEALGFDYDADNMYVDLLAEIGVVGAVLFLMFFIRLMKDVVRKREVGDYTFLYILIMQLILGLGETVFDSQLFWCVVMLAMIYLRNDKTPTYET